MTLLMVARGQNAMPAAVSARVQCKFACEVKLRFCLAFTRYWSGTRRTLGLHMISDWIGDRKEDVCLPLHGLISSSLHAAISAISATFWQSLVKSWAISCWECLVMRYCVQFKNHAIEIALIRVNVMSKKVRGLQQHYIQNIENLKNSWNFRGIPRNFNISNLVNKLFELIFP